MPCRLVKSCQTVTDRLECIDFRRSNAFASCSLVGCHASAGKSPSPFRLGHSEPSSWSRRSRRPNCRRRHKTNANKSNQYSIEALIEGALQWSGLWRNYVHTASCIRYFVAIVVNVFLLCGPVDSEGQLELGPSLQSPVSTWSQLASEIALAGNLLQNVWFLGPPECRRR